MTFSERSRVGWLAAAVFIVSVARQPAIFLYPSFWAEDGTYLFKQSLELGFSSLWTPVVDMYITSPRLVALLVSAFPVRWTPTLYALCAGMVSSLSLALFARSGLRWLVPQDGLRAILCLVFALVPGTTECFFALITQTYVLFLGALFLLLERDGRGVWQMGWRRAALLSFLWFSIGQGVVLAPLLIYLYARTRNRGYLLCLASLAVSVGLNLAAHGSVETGEVSAPLLLAMFVDNAFVRLVYLPLLGVSRLAPVLQLSPAAFLWLSTVVLMALIWLFGRPRSIDAEGARGLALAILGTMVVLVLSAVVRPYAPAVLLRPNLYLSGRYGLAPSILALVLAYGLLAPALALRAWRLATCLLLFWLTQNGLIEPLYQAPQPFLPFATDWPRQAARIQRALDKRREGTLQGTVAVKRIQCRPGPPRFPPIRAVRIAP